MLMDLNSAWTSPHTNSDSFFFFFSQKKIKIENKYYVCSCTLLAGEFTGDHTTVTADGWHYSSAIAGACSAASIPFPAITAVSVSSAFSTTCYLAGDYISAAVASDGATTVYELRAYS